MNYRDKVRNRSKNDFTFTGGGLVTWFKDRLRSHRPAISSRWVLICFLMILMVGGLACQVVWQQVRHMRGTAEIADLKRKNHELSMKIQQKQLVISRLERLERIQRIALNRLGMEPLGKTPVIEMSKTHWVQSSRKGGRPNGSLKE